MRYWGWPVAAPTGHDNSRRSSKSKADYSLNNDLPLDPIVKILQPAKAIKLYVFKALQHSCYLTYQLP
jgi:hypothetical protein